MISLPGTMQKSQRMINLASETFLFGIPTISPVQLHLVRPIELGCGVQVGGISYGDLRDIGEVTVSPMSLVCQFLQKIFRLF